MHMSLRAHGVERLSPLGHDRDSKTQPGNVGNMQGFTRVTGAGPQISAPRVGVATGRRQQRVVQTRGAVQTCTT